MSGSGESDFMVDALAPSFRRYRNLCCGNLGLSTLRMLQYEVLSQHSFKGKVLDFGGGKKISYYDLIECSHYDSVNIDPKIEPTWVTRVGETLPCEDNYYDSVVSLNTFEHIFDTQFVIREIARVLKPGGEFVLSTPFLFPIHGHPDDFFRPTPNWWRQSLLQAEFDNIRVMPLTWGPFSCGAICSGIPGPFRSIRRHISLLLDILVEKVRARRHRNQTTDGAVRAAQNYVSGLFVWANKKYP